MSAPIVLPILTVQPSFTTVISEVDSGIIPSDTFWISCYKTSSPSVHAKIQVSLDELKRDVVKLDSNDRDVQIERHALGEGISYTAACPALGIPQTKVLLPRKEFADPERSQPQHPQRILAFDIAPDGSQFATGFHDGSVHLYPTSPSTGAPELVKKMAKAHFSSITSLRFFPSSRVLLSAGADFTLNILPAEPPSPSVTPSYNTVPRISPARTFRGHTRSITDTAIVSRGRNILSCSADGTVRLWDVSSGERIHSFVTGQGKFTSVAGMSLGERGQGEVGRRRPDGEEMSEGGEGLSGLRDNREVDTGDKVAFCALQDGSFETFDLGSKRSVYQSVSTPTSRTPLSAISYSPSHNLLATGSVNGVVTLFDTRSLSTPLTAFTRNTACIQDLVLTSNYQTYWKPDVNRPEDVVGLVVATEDGLPFVASVRPEGPGVLAEIVGGDCDGVRAVRVGTGGDIWTAADDGIVRMY